MGKPLLILLFLTFGSSSHSANSTNILTEMLEAFRSTRLFNVTEVASLFRMPACLSNCMPNMGRMINAISNNRTAEVAELCSGLEESAICAERAGCSRIFTDAALQTFQFACMAATHNTTDVNTALECLLEASSDYQVECENECNIQGRFLDKKSYDKMDEMVNTPTLCNSSICLIHCFHKRVISKCKGPTQLIDALLSSLVNSRSEGPFSFDEGLNWLVPEACKHSDAVIIDSIGKGAGRRGPNSVGKPARDLRGLDEQSAGKNNSMETETALLIDGQFRSLQCRMFDWKGNEVQTPDFESLARILAAQILPFSSSGSRPTLSVPSDTDLEQAENRVQNRLLRDFDNNPVLSSSTTNPVKIDDDGWASESADLIVPVDCSFSLNRLMLGLVFVANLNMF